MALIPLSAVAGHGPAPSLAGLALPGLLQTSQAPPAESSTASSAPEAESPASPRTVPALGEAGDPVSSAAREPLAFELPASSETVEDAASGLTQESGAPATETATALPAAAELAARAEKTDAVPARALSAADGAVAGPDVERAERVARPREGTAPPPRPDLEGRANDILQQIRLHLDPRARQAVVQLEPAELGRISIRIALRRGQVHAELRVERAETLSVLERHAPELRAQLERAGLESGELSLSLGDPGDPRGFEPPLASRGGSAAGPRERGGRGAEAPDAARAAAATALRSALAQSLGIDTYA